MDLYIKDLPLERVADRDVLLAYELNGEALPVEHGFPVRVIVPGFYGTNSVKWLYRIELSERRAPGPFTTTDVSGRTQPVGGARNAIHGVRVKIDVDPRGCSP